MSVFLVSYDLHHDRNYPPVWEYLERLGGNRLLESLWVVNTPLGAGELRGALTSLADNTDSIVVVEAKPGAQWSAIRAKPSGTAMLQGYVTTY